MRVSFIPDVKFQGSDPGDYERAAYHAQIMRIASSSKFPFKHERMRLSGKSEKGKRKKGKRISGKQTDECCNPLSALTFTLFPFSPLASGLSAASRAQRRR